MMLFPTLKPNMMWTTIVQNFPTKLLNAQYHLIPVLDTSQHLLDAACSCKPRYDVESISIIWTHNAFDKRL